MTYLLVTNIVSELRRARPHGAVLEWLSTIAPSDLFVSAVTFGELQAGFEKQRSKDRAKADEIERWLEQQLIVRCILTMDAACFRQYARLMRG